MPLAIELAAALTPHFPPDELLAAIRQNLALLVSARRDLDARHRRFSAVLHSSWQTLSPAEQQVLAQCSVFVGPFSREAAHAVTGATVGDLVALVDQALLQQRVAGVYQLHELLRHFAAGQLHTMPCDADAAAQRHSAYYLDFVAAREKRLARHAPRQAVEEIQQEMDNIRQAWAWATDYITDHTTDHTTQALAASAYSLWQFYLVAGLYAEGVAAFRQAAEGVQAVLAAWDAAGAPDAADTSEELGAGEEAVTGQSWQRQLSSLLAFEAYLLCALGQHSRAQTLAQQAIALGVAHDNPEGELIGLTALAQAHYLKGEADAAKTCAEQVLQRARRLQWRDEPAEFYYDAQLAAFLYLGVIARNADDYAQATVHWRQAFQLCNALGKMRGVMHARLNFANLARYHQQYASARKAYEQVLQIACELGYRWGEGVARHELADVMRGQGEYSSALEQYTHAAAILREIGEAWRDPLILSDLACLYTYLGDRPRAADGVQQALARSQALNLPNARQKAWLAAALFHHHSGNDKQALAYATQCRQLAQAHNSRRYAATALIYMGYALEGLARWDAAHQTYQRALHLYQALGIQPAVVEAQAGLARIRLALGNQPAASRWVNEIWSWLLVHPNAGVDEPFLIYLTCYRVLAAAGDPRAALALQAGYELLQQYANHIQEDALRQAFLENVATHRELQQLYQAWRAAQGANGAST